MLLASVLDMTTGAALCSIRAQPHTTDNVRTPQRSTTGDALRMLDSTFNAVPSIQYLRVLGWLFESSQGGLYTYITYTMYINDMIPHA
jgi:hypothetical protein